MYKRLCTNTFLLLLFAALTSPSVFCQPALEFNYITINDGLASNRISAILRDSKSFVWIGSYGGLNKFDGYAIKSYHYALHNKQSLCDNNITCLYEDSQKKMWIGTFNGLNLYLPENDAFEMFVNNKNELNSISNNYIAKILEDDEANLWIATSYGLNTYNRHTKKFVAYFIHNSESFKDANTITGITRYGNNSLYIVTHANDLYRFDLKSHTFSIADTAVKLGKDDVKRIVADNRGSLWIATEKHGLYKYNVRSRVCTHVPSSKAEKGTNGNAIKDVFQYDSTYLSIAVDQGGVDFLNLNNGVITNYASNNAVENDLNNNGIWTLYKDCENIFWVGTSAGGINYSNALRNKFKLYRHNPSNKNSLCYNAVLSFFEDSQGLIWIGTDGGGVSVFDSKKKSFTNYAHDKKNANSLSGNVVTSITEDAAHNVWLTTWDAGLNKFDRKTEHFKSYVPGKNNPLGLSSKNYWSSTVDGKGRIWLSIFDDGIEIIDPHKGIVKKFEIENETRPILPYQYALFLKTYDNNIWICKNVGISIYDSVSNTIKDIKNSPDDILLTITQLRNREIWVGTEKTGIMVLSEAGKMLRSIAITEGGMSSRVNGICEDLHGIVWISTDNGLYKYNVKTGEKRLFTIADGLQGDIFWRNTSLLSKTGKLYFGGYNGFNEFDPDSLKFNTFLPDVYINELSIFNKPVLPGTKNSPLRKSISETSELILSYTQSFFSFSFTASNYTHPENCKFAYKMEGFDKDWNYTTAQRRYAAYTNLNPGNYTFEVKACNNDGLWNENAKKIKIVIVPPFWKTSWFVASLIITFIVLLYSFFNYRLYRIKYQRSVLRKMVDERTRELHENNVAKDKFISIMAHDIRNPLGGISSVIALLNDEFGELDDAEKIEMIAAANRSSDHLKGLLDNLLIWLRSTSGRLPFKPTHIQLHNLIESIVELLSANTLQKHIRINNLTDKNIALNADKEQLTLIFRNILSNAIKYSYEKSEIDIRSAIVENDICIEIQDWGTGMLKEKVSQLFSIEKLQSVNGTKNERGTGFGLILVKEAVKAHNGQLVIESEVGKGTTVKLYLPIA